MLASGRAEAAPGQVSQRNVRKGLHSAVLENDLRAAELLLRTGAHVNVRNKHGRTPLMGASYYGHVDLVRLLLAYGADVDMRCKEGATALMYAALSGQETIVQMLLDVGAKRDVRAARAEVTALHCARVAGNPNVIHLIEARDILSELPYELAHHVLSFLDVSSILAVALTCHSWHRLANDTLVWRRLCARRGWSRPEVDMLMSFGVNAHRLVYAERNTLRRNWRAGRATAKVLYGHTDGIFSLAVAGSTALSGGSDSTLRSWNTDTGEGVAMAPTASPVTALAMLPAGDRAIAGDKAGHVVLWRAEDLAAPVDTVKAHDHLVSAVALDTADFFATSSFDTAVKLWTVAPAAIMASRTLNGHGGDVHALRVRGTTIVSGSFDRTVRLWDSRTAVQTACLNGLTNTVLGLELQENVVISSDRDGWLRLWDTRMLRQQRAPLRLESWARSVHVQNGLLIAGCHDGAVRAWDWPTCTPQWTLSTHRLLITSMHLDDERIVTASRDGTLRVEDFAAPRDHLLRVYSDHLGVRAPTW